MSHPYHHAVSSARRFGGTADEHLPLHAFFDSSKASLADARHRCLLHHSAGIFIAEQRFGVTMPVTGRDGRTRRIPVRPVGEQHVMEDYGCIPSVAQAFAGLRPSDLLTMNLSVDRVDVHAERTAQHFGGPIGAHRDLHAFLEQGRDHLPPEQARGLLHHAFGVGLAVQIFGERHQGVDVRGVLEDHLRADMGCVPTAEQTLRTMPLEGWMSRGAALPQAVRDAQDAGELDI